MFRKAKFAVRFPRGFTLIELLVVVAIISALVGILMPALSRARTTARRTACKSNLHQTAAVFRMYLDTESHDVYPDAVQMPSVDNTAPGIATVLKSYLSDPKLLKCPSDQPNDTASDGRKDYYFNLEGTSYEYPPYVRGRKANELIEEKSSILFDFEAFHGPVGAKGSINFLNADGSVED